MNNKGFFRLFKTKKLFVCSSLHGSVTAKIFTEDYKRYNFENKSLKFKTFHFLNLKTTNENLYFL